MMKRILSGFLALALVVCMIPTPANAAGQNSTVVDSWDGQAATSFDSGNGTTSSPYVVRTAEQLAYLAQCINNGTLSSPKVILANNIDLSGHNWTPIGNSSSRYFAGNFNGNGYTISGLQIQSSSGVAGLFGYNSGTISNLKLNISNFSVSYGSAAIYAGAVAAYNRGTIEFAEVSGNITATNPSNTTYYIYCGGIAGYNSYLVEACAYTGNITVNSHGGYHTGGLIGSNAGALSASYFKGNVTGKKTAASSAYTFCVLGGLVGNNGGSVTNCYAVAAVKNNVNYSGSNAIAGGLVGECTSTSALVTKSFAQNAVYAYGAGSSATAGGLVGHARGTISYCYANNKVETDSDKQRTTVSGRIVGGNESTSIVSTYYNGGNILSRVESYIEKETVNAGTCDEYQRDVTKYRTCSNQSNTLYSGAYTYSASFIKNTLKWGSYTNFNNYGSDVHAVWVVNSDRPYLFIENLHSLTVAYHRDDLIDHVLFAWLDDNQTYSYPSPARTGYTPNPDTVSGTITDDTIEDVVYERNKYTLTLVYLDADSDGTVSLGRDTYSILYGDTYEIVPPKITGYNCISGTITGTMGAGDETVYAGYQLDINYLNVNYIYEDGTQAAPSISWHLFFGEEFSVTSPTIPGYTASRDIVSGVMGEEDITINVIYGVNTYVVTLVYQDNYGQVLGQEKYALPYGTSYSINTATFTGYTPDKTVVSGNLEGDVTHIITYNPNRYTVTVHYVDEAGNQLTPTEMEIYAYGDFYHVYVPRLAGMVPDREILSGIMPAEDLEFTITYHEDAYPLTIIYQHEDGTLIRKDVYNIQNGFPYNYFSPSIPNYTPSQTAVKGTMRQEPITVTVTYTRDVTAQGVCGANMSWILYGDGELVISGSGDMHHFQPDMAPWADVANLVKKVTVTEGVTSVGNNAFANCPKLTQVSLADTVTTLGEKAFYCCNKLENFHIPSSLTTIGAGAFAKCDLLYTVTVDPANTAFTVKDNVLYSADQKTLVLYPAGLYSKSFSIPTGVETVGAYAFYGNTTLENVTIPNTVSAIGDSAFEGTTGITKLQLSAPAIAVGERAFYNSNLEMLIVEGNVTSLGEMAFASGKIYAAYFKGDAPLTTGNSVFGTEDGVVDRFCLYYPLGNDTWDTTVVVSGDKGYKTELWQIYYAYAYNGVGDVTVDNAGGEQVYAVFVYCDKSPMKDVSVTFDGITKQTDSDGFVYFTYKNLVQTTLRVRKDKYVSPYELNTMYSLKTIGVDYINLTTDSSVDGVSCYGNDITAGVGYINVKYAGKISVLVKGNTAFNITKMELYQRVPDAEDSSAPWINKVLQTIYADSENVTEDGYGKFLVDAAAFAYSEKEEYPIFVRMYTDSGENAVERQLRIKTVSFTMTADFSNLLKETNLTLSDTGIPFLDGIKLQMKTPVECPLSIKIVNNEVYVTWDLDDDAFDSVVSSVTGVEGLGNAIKNKMENTQTRVKEYMTKMSYKADEKLSTKTKAFSARKHTPGFSLETNMAGGFCFAVGEGNEVLSIRSYVKATIEMKATWTAEYWILYLPVVLEIQAGAQGEFEIVGLGYDLQNSKLLMPDVNIGVEASLSVSLGLGCRVISAGAFARLKLAASITLGEVTYFDGLVLNGEWGIYAKLDVGFFSLYAEKAWQFMEVELIPKASTAKMFSAPDENGYMGRYKGVSVYDLSAYSLQRSVDVEDAQWAKDFSTDIETNTYAYAEPQLISCGNATLAVYLADDQDRNTYNAQKLVYRIYDASNDSWSEPYQLDNNGTSDSSFSLATYNGTIYIAYTESDKTFTPADMEGKTDQQSAVDMSMAQEVVVAAYNPDTQRFESFTTLTDNGYFDASPVLEQIGDKLYVAWTTNYATDESLVFGMNGSNDVNLCYFDGSRWSDTDCIVSDCNPVSEMVIADLEGKPYVAMLIDEDANYYTTEDSNIYIADAQGDVTFIDCYGTPVGNLQTAVYQGQNMLTWYCGGGVKKLTSLNTAPEFFLEQKFAITQDYRLVNLTEDILALTWSIKGIKDDSQQLERSLVYMKLIDHNGEWTETAAAFEAPYYMMSYDMASVDGDMQFIYVNTMMEPGDDGNVTMTSKLCAYSLTTGYDLQVGDVSEITVDSANGKVSLDVELSNNGIKTVHNISAILREYDANTGKVKKFYAVGVYSAELLSGETKTLQLTADLIPGVDLENADMLIEVYEGTENDLKNRVALLNDSLNWSSGSGTGDVIVQVQGGSLAGSGVVYPSSINSDLKLEGEYILIGDTEYLSLKVTNLGNMDGSAMVNVAIQDADGGLLCIYTANIRDLQKNGIKYFLVELKPEHFDSTTATFRCWFSHITDADPEDNNSLQIDVVRMEGAGGTERDDNAVASQLSSYHETYDKNSGKDLELDITLNGNQYVGLRDLEANEYATYVMNPDGTVLHMTVSQVYLNSLALGDYEQVFLFLTQCGYIDCVLNLSIIDTTPIDLTGSIALNGTPQRGELLTVDISQLNTEEVEYAWILDGEVVSTDPSYLVSNEALGKGLSVTVSGTGLYRGSVTAQVNIPKVERNINAPKVTIVDDDTLQLKKGFVVGDGTVEYGWASVNDPNQVTNWTTDNTVVFQWDDLYYLFMRVTGSEIYEDAVSEPVIYSNRDARVSIDKVSLRSSCAGLYFTANFDIEGIAVKRTGIAVSLYNELPTADGSDETSLWTEDSTSVLIADILTQDNTALENNKRAMMPIYARAYAELADGTIVYSEAVCVNLRSLVEAVDAKLDKLSEAQLAEFTALYEKYADTMSRWNIPNIKAR